MAVDGSRVALAATAFMLLAASVPAASRPKLIIGKQVELPSVGLRVEVMTDAKESPLQPPAAFTYEFRRGPETRREDMYRPVDLWRQSQHLGKWTDESGNSLTLAAVLSLPPDGFGREHVLRKEYEERVAAAQTNRPPEWSPALLAQWASDFTGTPGVAAQGAPRAPPRLRSLVPLALPSGRSQQLAYVFSPQTSSAGQGRQPPPWFFALLELNPAIDLAYARTVFEQQFFNSILTVSAARPPTAAPAWGFRGASAPASTNRSGEFVASKRQVTDSIRNSPDWWYVETEHYIILSDMKSRFRPLVMRLQTDIETLRTAFAQAMPPRQPIAAVSVIRLFATSEEYVNYVSPNLQWSGGQWMPMQKELVIRPIDWGGSQEQRDRVLKAVYHEAFHQYLFYAYDMVQPSPWFNEGHAAYFENARVSAAGVTVDEDEDKAAIVEDLIRSGQLDIAPVVRMSSYADFYGQADATRQKHYSEAWALVYYLRRATAGEKTSPYSGILSRYCDALWSTRAGAKATAAALAGVRIDELNRALVDFWQTRHKRAAVRRNRVL